MVFYECLLTAKNTARTFQDIKNFDGIFGYTSLLSAPSLNPFFYTQTLIH